MAEKIEQKGAKKIPIEKEFEFGIDSLFEGEGLKILRDRIQIVLIKIEHFAQFSQVGGVFFTDLILHEFIVKLIHHRIKLWRTIDRMVH